MINAGFSTSGQKPAAGRRGSAVWSATAAEDFLRTKGGSAAPQRKPRADWRICVRLQGCVNKACVWGGLQPDSKAMSQTATMTQNTRTAVLLPFVSPKYHKWGFKLSRLSDHDIFPVSHPSDRNTELSRQWFLVGVHLGPEWSQGASVLGMSLGCGPNMQQSSTLRARSIFNFCNIVQRIDADATKKQNHCFHWKSIYFLDFTVIERKKERPAVNYLAGM